MLKGPVSELYGSGSLGGVVNILTKKGGFSRAPWWNSALSGACDSNPRGLDGHGAVTFNSPDTWVHASAGYRDHDSYTAGNGGEIPNSQYRDASASLGTGIRWNPKNTTELQAQYLEARNVGIPGLGTSLPTGPDVTYPRTSRALAGLTHTLTPEGSLLRESTLNLYYQNVQRRVRIDNFPSGPVLETDPGADHDTWGMKWLNIIAPDRHTLVTGLDIWQWEIHDTERTRIFANGQTGVDSSLGNVSQLSAGLFAEDDWSVSDGLTLNLGARFDGIRSESDDLYDWIVPPSTAITPALKREGGEQTDPSRSAHLGLTWNPAPACAMTFLASSGYRAPDLMDRFKYINLGGGVSLYGNPELDPERSIFLEYGLHANTETLRLSASAYADFLKDLITEQIVTDTSIRMENVDKARITGMELDLEWMFHVNGSLYGNLAYADGRNTSAGESLPSIPPLNGLLGIRYNGSNGFWAGLETQWAAAQHDVPPGTAPGEAWATLNLRAGYRFPMARTRHDIVIGIDNLLDKDYRNYLSASRGIELKEPGIGGRVTWQVGF